nr:histidine--tRNA ligase [uncultured Gemmiger sp.]
MKTQPLKGMRDLLPKEQALRDHIQAEILATYRAAGFQRISTPILEDMENLNKSDGGDNLNLIFKVLKRGEKLAAALRSGDESQLSDMGLRYDLTLPLSRYYAANRNSLPHPFKVIQTDRVYRAERPQKGRLREFVQCDIDILGDASPNAEVELIDVTARALLRIGFSGFTVNINDRRILRAMLAGMGFAEDTLDSVCISFDKLDKIGADGVRSELEEKGFPAEAISALDAFLRGGDFSLEAVTAACGEQGPELTADLRYVLATAEKLAAGRYGVAYCPSLVRGQGYYTGMVFEVTCPQFSGAVAGGGRYDNMVGKFIGQTVPAVGFSIGFERVCGILLEQGYTIPGAKPKLALLYLPEADFADVLTKAERLRADYDVTVLPQAKKLGKQFGTLEAAGFNAAAFADNDDIKPLGQKG